MYLVCFGVNPGGLLILPGFPAHFIEVEAAAKDKRVAAGIVGSMLLAGPSDVGDQVWGRSGYHGTKSNLFFCEEAIFLVIGNMTMILRSKPNCKPT